MGVLEPGYFIFVALISLTLYKLRKIEIRLFILCIASILFYWVCVGYQSLLLVLIASLAYIGGLLYQRQEKHSILHNAVFLIFISSIIAPLLLFKYAPATFLHLPDWAPIKPSTVSEILLPIGISFYTFQAVGYLLDVHIGLTRPVTNYIRFFAFMAMFPQLLAGPIARSTQLLVQLDNLGSYSRVNFTLGLQSILTGLFMKIVIADNLSPIVEKVYASPQSFNSADLALATTFFSFQVYADFAGYSLIAIGVGRLMGIELLKNFQQPYLSKTLPEYWRTWHISLSSWFRDYVFNPLHFHSRRLGKTGLVIALIATFTIVGSWHGSGIKYALFGATHGILVAGSALTLKIRDKFWEKIGVPTIIVDTVRIFATFIIITLTFVLFKAESIFDAIYIYKTLSTTVSSFIFNDFGEIVLQPNRPTLPILIPFGLILILIFGDLVAKRGTQIATLPTYLRWCLYHVTFCVLFIVLVDRYFSNVDTSSHFIYFKF